MACLQWLRSEQGGIVLVPIGKKALVSPIPNSKNFSHRRNQFSLFYWLLPGLSRLSLGEDEGFQQVGPGLFVGGNNSQDVLDRQHSPELPHLTQHDQVEDAVLFH